MKTTNVKTPLPLKGWGKLFLLLTIVSLSSAYSQVGIGTTTPDASAVLEIDATDKGFLPPRMTTAQRDAITNPAEGLTIYNTENDCLEFWNDNYWVSACDGAAQPGALSDCPTIVPFLSADDTEIVDVTNPITGDTWMDRNLGAFTADRSTPGPAGGTDCWAYGNLYQWGRAPDGHEYRDSGTTSTNATTAVPNAGNAWDGLFITEGSSPYDWLTLQDNTLWQGVIGTNNPCPAGYRVPTEAELNDERLSWSNNNREGAITSPLKLPVAGYRLRSTGGLDNVGSAGGYWSSTVSGTNAGRLLFDSSGASMSADVRAFGFSVRCLKD